MRPDSLTVASVDFWDMSRNLGSDYYEHRDVDRARARAIHALERLGVKVTVEAVA